MSLNRLSSLLKVILCCFIVAISAMTVFAQVPKAKQPAATSQQTQTPRATQPQPAAPAQQPAANAGQLERPPADMLRVEKLSPELEQILKDWETSSAKIQQLRGEHTKITYDYTWDVEKKATGTFYYQAPDKGSFVVEGIVPQKSDVSKKTNAQKKPFTLKPESSERWVCDGVNILQIDDTAKTYAKFPIPPEQQGKNIIEGPLPFLFGMKAAQAKQRYFLQLDPKLTNDKQICLQVQPRRREDAANWAQATVLIMRDTFLPKAVKLIDPTGKMETVYIFENLDQKKPVIIVNNPLTPNLRGYKQIVPNAAATAPAADVKTKEARTPDVGAAKVPAVAPAAARTATATPANGASLGKAVSPSVKK